MTTWGLIWACAIGAILVLGGVAWTATWPVARTKGRHRRDGPPNPANPALDTSPLPLGPTAEEWMWTTDGMRVKRPQHRHEHVGQGTTALRWYDRPSGPQPLYPKPPPVD